MPNWSVRACSALYVGVAVAAATITRGAHAQWGEYAAITRDEVAVFCDEVGLTATEREAIFGLHEAMRAELTAAGAATDDLMQWVHAPLDLHSDVDQLDSELRPRQDRLLAAWGLGARNLEAAFFGSLRSMLPNRITLVEAFERTALRTRMFTRTRLPRDGPWDGASFDIILWMKAHAPNHLGADAVARVLAEWETAVDSLLKELDRHRVTERRNRWRITSEAVAIRETGGDPDDILEEMAAHTSRGGRVLCMLWAEHEKAIHQLVPLLGDALGNELTAAGHDALIAWVFEESDCIDFIERTLDRRDLTDSTHEQLEALHTNARALRDNAIPSLVAEYRANIRPALYDRIYLAMARAWYYQDRTLTDPREEWQAMERAQQRVLGQLSEIEQQAKQVVEGEQ